MELIPIEIKAGSRVSLSDVRGLLRFIDTYPGYVNKAFVITNGRVPERLTDKIIAVPWKFL
jgi:hypothetical protein